MEDQKMTKIVLELPTCKKCPFHLSTPYRTEDSWESAEYYWCKCPDTQEETRGRDDEGEETRLHINKDGNYDKLSYVAGYVEWRDEIPIPDVCPIKLKE